MGRKRQENTEVSNVSLDAIFKQKLQEMKAKDDMGKVYIDGDDEVRVMCLDVPLALKILFQLPGLPLGRFMVIAGEPETCKSALSYEFGRLHRRHGGGYSLIETENKDSTSLRKSVVGYDDARSSVVYVESSEEWMRALRYQMNLVNAALDDYKPPRSVPWCFVVDSIAGVTTEGVNEQMVKDGVPKQSFNHAARMLTEYMKNIVHLPENHPDTVVFVSHQKLSTSPQGLPIKKIVGGYAPRFHESIEINASKAGGQYERKEPFREYVKPLKLATSKNSLAPNSPLLMVDFVWFFEQVETETGEMQMLQRSFFDWAAASIQYLSNIISGTNKDFSATERKQISECLDLHVGREKTVWSDRLGIPKSSPVHFRVAGRILDSRPDLQKELLPLLYIRQAFMFEPGVDLLLQRKAAQTKIYRRPGDFSNFVEMPVTGGAGDVQEETADDV